MNLDELKNKLISLSVSHQAASDKMDGIEDAELIELEAEQFIISFCEANGYLVNGFPTEKKQLPEEELEADYFCRERYQFYLDTLAIQKEDVADLMWCYVSYFWPEQYESKAEYLQNLKENLESGVFYEVSL